MTAFAFQEPQSEAARAVYARIADLPGGSTIKQMSESRSDVFHINPFLIRVEADFNGRDFSRPEVEEHVEMLTRQIVEHGVRRPLRLINRNNQYFLTDGECRLRAVMRAMEKYGAEFRTIPVQLENRFASPADAAVAQFTDNSGMSFSPMEQIKPIKRMLNYGWSIADIAQKIGQSAHNVTRILELDTLPEAVKQMISKGVVSSSTAYEVFRDNNKDEDATIAAIKSGAQVANSKGSTRVTRKHLAASGAAPRSRMTPAKFKQTVFDAFRDAIVERDFEDEDAEGTDQATDDSDRIVLITMSAAKYEQIRDLVGLDLAEAA